MAYRMVCPACGTLYSSESTEGQPCLHCGATVVYTGFTKEEFDQKTPEQRQWILDSIRGGRIQNRAPKIQDTSFWVSLLNTCINILICVGVIGSIFFGAFLCDEWTVALGLVVMIGGPLVTFISAALIKIVLSAAKDLKFIRNYLETKG